MTKRSAAARSPSSTVTTAGARTLLDPWSPVTGMAASRPTTASDRTSSGSRGRTGWPADGPVRRISLRSSTIDRSATSRASARWASPATAACV
jgi:hypothetical protein